MLVVYAHAIDLVQRLNVPAHQIKWGYLENFGAIGVDIFFVISGFIMAYLSRNLSSKKDAFQFLQKRIVRIYPLYLCITLILVLKNFPSIETLIKDITLVPLFDKADVFVPLTISVAWSLSFELFFYFVVFASILQAKKNHLKATVICFISLATIGSIFLFKETHLQFIFNPIYFEFVLGIFICQLFFRYRGKIYKTSYLLLLTAIVFYILLICFGYKNISEVSISIFGDKGLWRVLLWGIPSAVFVAAFVFLESQKKYGIFKNKLLNLIGDASYSIYLIHILSFPILIKLNIFKLETISGDLLIFILMAFAVISGILVYLIIEKPLLKFINTILKKNKA